MPPITMRVFKSWGAPIEENQWVNNYEFMNYGGDISITAPELTELMDVIVAAERAIHLTEVYFTRVTFSTWQADSKPYDPTTFVSFPLSVQGTRTHTSQAVDRNNVYFVKKVTSSGRYGKFFYRGCLTEADVESGADLRWRLTAGTGLAPGGADFSAYDLALQSVIAPSTPSDPSLALISQVGLIIRQRPVLSVSPAGVRVNRSNHRYFDRA